METTGKYGAGHVVIAVLGGTVLGALAAFLLAPKSGRDTRKQIVGYFNDAKDTLSRVPEAFRNASHAVGETFTEPRA